MMQRSRIMVIGSSLLGLVVLTAGLYYFSQCPCERLPGSYLLGEVEEAPVTDWSFANEVELCQLEVRHLLPHSINLNCMSKAGELFLSCSRCEGKFWSNTALANPRARIRIGLLVYPVLLRKLEETSRLDVAWQARTDKLGGVDHPRPDHWWSFSLTYRQ